MLLAIIAIAVILTLAVLVEHLGTVLVLALVLAALALLARGFLSQLMVGTFKLVNRWRVWHRLPKPLAVLNLAALRIELREKNLYDVPKREDLPPPGWSPEHVVGRTDDGSFNDLDDPDMGRAGARFGRNFPLAEVFPETDRLMTPNPREVSRKLMVRRSFQPATTLNLLAAAWIQFQVHDWMAHKLDRDDGLKTYDVPLEDDDDFPEKPMRIVKTLPDDPGTAGTPPSYVNTESHWWDMSGVYGKSTAKKHELRTGEHGKIKVEPVTVNGEQEMRLLENPDPDFHGVDHTGFFDNYWIGLSILHTIFTQEHNAICDALRTEYPTWSDEKLFDTARLINCALTAKIHTVEWTPGILANPALQVSMDANWWGLLGENLKKNFGRLSSTEELSGIIGSATDHHTASYSLTEEFVSVYRMHPLIPDEIPLRAIGDGRLLRTASFTDIQGHATRAAMADLTGADLFYSFGVTHPGAIRLFNYPDTLRQFRNIQDDLPVVDLAALDILRDRERGVPRYNRFRQLLHMKPVTRFDEITSNKEWASAIAEVYGGDIEQVDTMVGLLAEDLPQGFGFSDTAFRIFILMASRRLKSDRFFTRDYNATTYTQLGLDWVDNNGMESVLLRHYPKLAPALRGVANPFAPWNPIDKHKPAT